MTEKYLWDLIDAGEVELAYDEVVDSLNTEFDQSLIVPYCVATTYLGKRLSYEILEQVGKDEPTASLLVEFARYDWDALQITSLVDPGANEFEERVRLYTTAIQKVQRFSQPWLEAKAGLASLFFESGFKEEARQILRETDSHWTESSSLSWLSYTLVPSRANAEQIAEYWSSRCSFNGTNYREYIQALWFETELAEHRKAHAVISSFKPRTTYECYRLARIRRADGDYQGALEVLSEGYKDNATDPRVVGLRARCLGQLGRLEEAKRLVLSTPIDNETPWWFLVTYFQMVRRSAEQDRYLSLIENLEKVKKPVCYEGLAIRFAIAVQRRKFAGISSLIRAGNRMSKIEKKAKAAKKAHIKALENGPLQ